MEANELRIGNLVTFDKKVMPIAQVSVYDVTVGRDDTEFTEYMELNQIEPILLTEEVWIKSGIQCEFYKNVTVIFLETGDFTIYNEQLQYLHQLQNIVFALTGTELKITE